MSEVLELRWESDWLVREEVTPAAGASSTVTGLADFSLGLKWHGGTLGAVGFGASYRVSAFWQLDTALSLGLNDRSTDVGLTVGTRDSSFDRGRRVVLYGLLTALPPTGRPAS